MHEPHKADYYVVLKFDMHKTELNVATFHKDSDVHMMAIECLNALTVYEQWWHNLKMEIESGR